MRLLALLTDAFGAGGGIARYNQALLAACSQSAAVREVVALPRFASPSSVVPAKVRQLPPSGSRATWSARAVAVAARGGYDTVFCGHLNALPLASMIAASLCARLWVQVHGIEAWHARGRVYHRGLARADLVTSVSRHTRQKLLEWASLPPHRVRVLPNTFAPAYARQPAADVVIPAQNRGERRIILTVGRLSASEAYKGHDRIIAAMPAILARVPKAAYWIVGSGDDQGRLRQLAQEAHVADRVVFAGHVADHDLPGYFASAHAFAMPSTGEGFGIVFLEAAASGLPVIGGSRDGSVDALADGRIGRLIDPASQDQLVAAVVEALEGRAGGDPAEVSRFRFENFSRHVDHLVRGLAH
jgi:phosphatidylinositol alpha-1,6-mannosyltransferase